MPELPDILLYRDALDRFLTGHVIENIHIRSPFLLRSVSPPIEDAIGKRIQGFSHLGKRIVWELHGPLFLVIHLMIAGRFHWRKPGMLARSKKDLAAIQFEHGTMMLTEVSQKKRASLHVVDDRKELSEHDPGGLDVHCCSAAEFGQRLCRENRTVKRALTNPKNFCGIGNAYSDEILWAARISPIKWTGRLSDEEIQRIYVQSKHVLSLWYDRLTEQIGERFPEKVTAFRAEMAAHGKFGKPCPACGRSIQRIVYVDNETNYCAECQNGGKVLADRSMSRLLRGDWPRTIEEWESDR